MLSSESTIVLPGRPAEQAERDVAAWRQEVVIDTYRPAAPDRYPAYLDQRVYQGSSGRVYPLPFFERIESEKSPQRWQAVHLENRWLRLMILPELGGRIHVGQDLTTGYDFFYRNNVIKPALIGLTGPWIAGGVEFNWPQHHRPATFLPMDVSIEYEESGAVTVWCSDHDPFTRMKGMHGIRLHPDRAVVEARVRLYNRDDEPRTFLWWANVAARAHDDYQSFFPTDVTMVADHAKRAVTAFPAADRPYYDIDYPNRPSTGGVSGARIDWYRNIPVPTSYMCLGSSDDFFGGYDHAAGAGFVHVADHQISVGKKQWTWGNAPFGRAWDRNLADDDAAYVELMAGVFTDNQPDFSFIAPGETKVFSQYWYPIHQIGPVQQATVEAAVRVGMADGSTGDGGTGDGVRTATVSVATTRVRPGCRVELRHGDDRVVSETFDVEPGRPGTVVVPLPAGADPSDVEVLVSQDDEELVRWHRRSGDTAGGLATEPPEPSQVGTVDELYRIGMHLAQYRHATRSPEPYWREALRRDAGHPGSCVQLAVARYRQGEYATAERLLRTAISRLTGLNPNAADTEAHYYLGLALVRLGRADEAYDSFGSALWTRTWRAPAGFQMARLDAAAGRPQAALDRLTDVLRCEPDHLQARSLRVLQLRRLGLRQAADEALAEQLALDPLDWWARDLAGDTLHCDAQTCLDVALEYTKAGEPTAALRVLDAAWDAEENLVPGSAAARPLIAYYRARLLAALGADSEAADERRRAAQADDRYCFPGRLDDADLLRAAAEDEPWSGRPQALLGHWLYAVGRHVDAVEAWQRAVELNPSDSVSWRNLGIAAFNRDNDPEQARRHYARALAAAPDEPRLRYESDQLDRVAGVGPARRLATVEEHRHLIERRDDATVELAHLLLTLDRVDDASALLSSRNFQPWEGGEGQTLRVWDRTCLALARRALSDDRPGEALAAVDAALDPPAHLGEARHPLANSAELHLIRGDALKHAGEDQQAAEEWRLAAAQVADFRSMSRHRFSAATAASIQAYHRLGEHAAATELIEAVLAYCDELDETPAVIDYFATSLPALLLFDRDQQELQDARVQFMRAQMDRCRGDTARAVERAERLLALDPNHHEAVDLLRQLRQSWSHTRGSDGVVGDEDAPHGDPARGARGIA